MFSLLLNHWGLQLFVCFLFICFYLIKKSCSFLFMLLIVLWNCNFLLVKEIRIRDILPDWLLKFLILCGFISKPSCHVAWPSFGETSHHRTDDLTLTLETLAYRVHGQLNHCKVSRTCGWKAHHPSTTVLNSWCEASVLICFVLWPNRSTRSKGHVPDVLWFSWQSFQTMHNSLFFFHLYLC